MKYAILEKSNHWRYQLIESNDSGLETLSYFLIDEIDKMGYTYFTDWLLGKLDQDWAHGNAYGVREYKDKIFVYFQYDLEGEDPYKNDSNFCYFMTTKEELLSVIESWMNILVGEPSPNSIIIKQENDAIRISPLSR